MKDSMRKTRLYVFNRDGFKCTVCGKKIDWTTGQMAHRIPKTKLNIKKYGIGIIDHAFNLRTTCSLKCNSAVLIDNNPAEKEQLIEAIRRQGKR
ncbi:HNH endonuclease [Treponema phagedenis]|uniref:HNH endonuclease n=1 Tax=Treponema phagedenis TaxID=162 RepID=A0A5C0S441_TREPH|nr:hypothetical protein [Treponema phagedenis]NVP22702.1 hypothetical protein [Treponema phagedenis]NVP23252.1 hypothetical protein [Treponema phagedenis]NVP23520.1 hypothetical protein [Treponema phagedenis]QEJ94650.1 hypothetical protein FUT79_05155 [Treponema phagedenis]QEJ95186.1 hypothetical protein FUT79_08230 [Treponema phagedenis]